MWCYPSPIKRLARVWFELWIRLFFVSEFQVYIWPGLVEEKSFWYLRCLAPVWTRYLWSDCGQPLKSMESIETSWFRSDLVQKKSPIAVKKCSKMANLYACSSQATIRSRTLVRSIVKNSMVSSFTGTSDTLITRGYLCAFKIAFYMPENPLLMLLCGCLSAEASVVILVCVLHHPVCTSKIKLALFQINWLRGDKSL